MSVNFMRAGAIVVALGALMLSTASYAGDYSDSSATQAEGSNMMPPPPPFFQPQPEDSDNTDMMQQQDMDMSPSSEGNMPNGTVGPQSKRAPIVKTKAKVSKR